MEKHQLKVNKRTVLGRKVKNLRKNNILPGNIYGKNFKSISISVPDKEFINLYEKVGETGLVNLVLDDEKYPVLIHNVQIDPVSSFPLHADFYKVDLKEKVSAKVPVVIIGEAPAVKDKLGVLLTVISEIEVEALPENLPDKIEVDISSLSQLDQSISVNKLKITEKVKVLTDGQLDIVKIAPLVSKEAQAMVEEKAKEEVEKEAEQAKTSQEVSAGEQAKAEVIKEKEVPPPSK